MTDDQTHEDAPEVDETTDDAHTSETSDTEAQEPQEPQDGQETPKEVKASQKYRRRAQEAEAERDQAVELVDALARRLIEHELPDRLSARAFWKLTDDAPASFLTPEGTVDRDRVKETVHQIETDLGLNRSPVVPDQESMPDYPSSGAGFEDAFKPKSDRW